MAGRGLRTLLALAIATLLAGGAVAQEAPAIVVVDQERLFQESLFGRRIVEELEQRSTALATENRAIEAELVGEERALTERRAQLSPEEFRPLADAFDTKVERLRAEQDAKTRALVTQRDAERQTFSRLVGPVLLEYMQRSGAAVMLDRRSVVVTSDDADITDELIAEVDARVGAGEGAPEPAVPEPAPAPPGGN